MVDWSASPIGGGAFALAPTPKSTWQLGCLLMGLHQKESRR